MNLYQIKLTDNQKAALEHLFAQGIIWSKTELSEAWDELRAQVKDATNTVAIINAIQDAKCNCTKAFNPAPKYDPCREFRKGDKVRLVQCNGRNPFDSFNGIEYLPDETIYTVEGDEYDNGKVELYTMDSCDAFEIHHSNLELVTPVEELERYILIHNELEKYYDVCWKDDDEPDGRTGRTRVRNTYWYHNPPMTYTQQAAKAAAEAECDRLNNEYRTEMEK